MLHEVEKIKRRRNRNIPGTGYSSFVEGNPILVLFKLAAIEQLVVEAEPAGSISHGEILLSLDASKSSHLTYNDEKNHLIAINLTCSKNEIIRVITIND